MLRVCILLVTFGLVSNTSAFDPESLARFKETGSCSACDLSGADLSGFVPSANGADPVDLRAARLSKADLNGIRLSGADLTGADLRGANLATANLEKARLRGADLTGAFGSFLNASGADFSGATLRATTACYDQNFTGAIFRGADLRDAKLCGSFWAGADLTGADLSGADLTFGDGPSQQQLDHACGDTKTELPSRTMRVPICATPVEK